MSALVRIFEGLPTLVRESRRCAPSEAGSSRVLLELHTTLKPGGELIDANPHGHNEVGWNSGRYGVYHDLERWRRFGEDVQFFLPGGGVLGPVDLLRRRRDSLAVFVGNEVQRIADQVNDAGLNLGLRKHRGDRLSSFMTRSQNFAPSVCSIHRPRISLVPSGRTPRAT